MPLGTAYLQAVADVRTYDADPACAAGIAAQPAETGAGCGVGTVIVGSARSTRTGGDLSLKFEDGARREIHVSRAAYRLFRSPGTLAFVQVRRSRITLFGDERLVDVTPDHPLRRIARPRTNALVALVAALAASAIALATAGRDALGRRANSKA